MARNTPDSRNVCLNASAKVSAVRNANQLPSGKNGVLVVEGCAFTDRVAECLCSGTTPDGAISLGWVIGYAQPLAKAAIASASRVVVI